MCLSLNYHSDYNFFHSTENLDSIFSEALFFGKNLRKLLVIPQDHGSITTVHMNKKENIKKSFKNQDKYPFWFKFQNTTHVKKFTGLAPMII